MIQSRKTRVRLEIRMVETETLGTIVCTEDGPSTEKIAFVIRKLEEEERSSRIPAHVGQYVSVETE